MTPQRDPAGTIKQNYAAGGFTLDVPLFQGGRLSAKQNETRLAAESLQQRYDSEKNLLLRDVSIAFGNTRTAFENIAVTDQLVRNARQTLDLTQARYNIGQSSIVDLNQAQLAATQAEIAHQEAIFDYAPEQGDLNNTSDWLYAGDPGTTEDDTTCAALRCTLLTHTISQPGQTPSTATARRSTSSTPPAT